MDPRLPLAVRTRDAFHRISVGNPNGVNTPAPEWDRVSPSSAGGALGLNVRSLASRCSPIAESLFVGISLSAGLSRQSSRRVPRAEAGSRQARDRHPERPTAP